MLACCGFPLPLLLPLPLSSSSLPCLLLLLLVAYPLFPPCLPFNLHPLLTLYTIVVTPLPVLNSPSQPFTIRASYPVYPPTYTVHTINCTSLSDSHILCISSKLLSQLLELPKQVLSGASFLPSTPAFSLPCNVSSPSLLPVNPQSLFSHTLPRLLDSFSVSFCLLAICLVRPFCLLKHALALSDKPKPYALTSYLGSRDTFVLQLVSCHLVIMHVTMSVPQQPPAF